MIPARVLVVEDERVVALHLRQQLGRLGYVVPAMCTEGTQALKKIQDIRPDVVLMDIHIEGDIDGIETASRIPDDLQIPVIYLSAYSEEATLERARSTKPYGYLLKPFSERELHSAIQMVLERRRADNLSYESALRLEELVAARTEQLLLANREIEKQTTERLAAERALHQAQKMETVGQLTGGVAHDFNNLMQVVVGNLSILLKLLPPESDKLRQVAEKAMNGAKLAGAVTQRLLAFARSQPLESKTIDVNRLINGMLDLFHRTLGEAITINLKLGPALWMVQADPAQLENTILNLAINARDAMADGGTLTIQTRNIDKSFEASGAEAESQFGPGVEITVADTGQGMDEETLAHAFEPFFTTKDVGKGTGLGLSQVYGFIKQSRGTVKLSSSVGIGTTARIFLPRVLQEPAPDGNCAESVPATPNGSETVLVVEDEANVRAFTVSAFTELGYRVLEVPDGPAALELLKRTSETIHLLFTDVVLPNGMNGPVLAGLAITQRPGMKVLFTTGYSRDAVFPDAESPVRAAMIKKPFTIADLANKVRDVLDEKIPRGELTENVALVHP